MARNRMIKPEFWTSEQVVECSPNARLLFVGLWNFSDDAGRHPESTRRVKMEIFPGDPFSLDDIQGWVDELIHAGLIQRYEVDGAGYWAVTGWKKHQRIEKPTVRHPPPPSELEAEIRRPLDDRSTTARRPLSLKGKEEKGKEEKGKEGKTRAQFKKPTLEELTAYCRERKNDIDPEHFIAHYTSNGWLVGGKSKMKDWKAAVQTWEKNKFSGGKNAKSTPGRGQVHADDQKQFGEF